MKALVVYAREVLTDVVVTDQPGKPGGRLTVTVLAAGIRPPLAEQRNHLSASARVEDGREEWRVAVLVGGVDLGSAVEKAAGGVDRVLLRGQVKRCHADPIVQ